MVEPGCSCDFHSPPAKEDRPLPAPTSRCSRPIKWMDDDPETPDRCIKCGNDVAPPCAAI